MTRSRNDKLLMRHGKKHGSTHSPISLYTNQLLAINLCMRMQAPVLDIHPGGVQGHLC